MLSITLLILLAAALFCGVGLLFTRLPDEGEDGAQALLSGFWRGWAAAIGLLQVWHFFFPVNAALLGIVAGLSAAGWVSFLRRRQRMRVRWLALALACLPVFVLANQSLYAPPYYDHGLYHLQTVKWFNQFAIVPGLGNLQHRLAFNSAQYLLAALLNSGPLHGLAYYVANTTLMLALAAQGMLGLIDWLANGKASPRANLLYALALPVALWQASAIAISGYAADIPIFALQIVVAGRLLRLLEQPTDAAGFRRQAVNLALLLAAGMTVKASFWVFAAAVGLILAGVWFFRWRRETGLRAGPLAWIGVLAMFLVPWLARNAVMSGYLLYPIPLLAIDAPWKMPGFLVNGISAGILAWARTYSQQLVYTGDWTWFQAWLARFDYEPRLGVGLAAVLLAGILLYHLAANRRLRISGGALAVLGSALVSAAYWFFSAPSYRFSGAALWLVLIAAVLWGCETLAQARSPREAWVAATLALLLFFFAFPAQFSRNLSLRTLFSPPREQQLAADRLAASGLTEAVTQYGVRVYLPADPTNEMCWDAPLPCTTPNDYFAGLRMFDVQDLQKGFYIVPSP